MTTTYILPKTVYVQNAEYDPGDLILVADESEERAAHVDLGIRETGRVVGVYVLAAIRELRVQETIHATPIAQTDLKIISNTENNVLVSDPTGVLDKDEEQDDEQDDEQDEDRTPMEVDDPPPNPPVSEAKEVPKNRVFDDNGHLRRRFTDHFDDLFPNLRSVINR